MKITDGEETKWETLDSVYLIRRPWLTARRDTVKLANGIVNDEFYVLEYPEWVNTIAVTKDGKFIMIRQYRHGIDGTSYEVCAGCCEEGEAPEEAARRELLEETGYAGGMWREIMTVATNASSMNNYTHCFVAEGVEKVGDSHLEPTEELSVFLLDEAEVLALLHGDVVKQATMAAPLWKYFYEKSCAATALRLP